MSSTLVNQPKQDEKPQLQWLDFVSDFMDSRFRIPFTNIRFGADSIIGLFPYAGDLIGFGISGILVATMVNHGASGKVVLKMIGNILLDALIGTIPILGDIFDFTYKANRRNFNLLKAYYQEGKHQGNAWWVFILIFILFFALLGLVFFLLIQLFQWLNVMAKQFFQNISHTYYRMNKLRFVSRINLFS
jgi:hypothetical protein